MNRVLKDNITVTIKTIENSQIVEVNLAQMPIADLALNLCLLNRGLVKSLTFVANKRLRIEKDERSKVTFRAIVAISSEQIRLTVNPIELEYWESFFLKYYRDNVAEVDHIDVEASTSLDNGEEVYVVFKVGNARPPLSAEAVRKLLDG